MARRRNQSPVECPFTILVDGREKQPYTFGGLTADANKRNRPLQISTQWHSLKTGDYSIGGMEDFVTVERKSLPDLYNTLGQHRDRFEREHERMAEMKRAMVVVEASWEMVLYPERWYDNWRSKLNPKTVMRTAVSWFSKYGVPWLACEDRRFAEIYTFRFLEKFYDQYELSEVGGEDEID